MILMEVYLLFHNKDLSMPNNNSILIFKFYSDERTLILGPV